MHADRQIPLPDVDLVEIARLWGWSNPNSEVLKLAQEAKDARGMKSGDLLVALGLVSEEQKERLLASKPAGVQTIHWFAAQSASVVPVERVLALKTGYAFYDHMALLSFHRCMQDQAVMARAEELDCAVMRIEETTPVVVFSTFQTLIKFRTLGREEKKGDPILRALGVTPILAVGSRDEISGILKTARSTEDTTGSLESTNIWNAESPENKSKPENREITRLMDHALQEKVTDIALKPYRSGQMQVQLRKFGQMISPRVVKETLGADVAGQVINLLMAKSGANPTNTIQRLPTDGQISYRSAVGEAFLRLSFIPLNHLGERRNLTSVSIRVLPRTEEKVSLRDLHLHASVVEEISFAMQMSQGLVLVVGPTNSGKSTTVAGALGEHVGIFGDTQKRLSVEDPIERFLYGVTQFNAPPEAMVSDEAERFNILLRGMKRHDPDLIWVGEVRDKSTAELCVATAATGHLVLSTMHANDAVMGFDVLAKAVEPDKRFQLVESMALVVSQRLVKEVCPECRIVAQPTESDGVVFRRYLDRVGGRAELPKTVARRNPRGCAECGEDGSIGLLPINEVLPFTREVKDAAIQLVGGTNTRDVLAKARTVTLLQSSLALVADHRIDFNDLLV